MDDLTEKQPGIAEIARDVVRAAQRVLDPKLLGPAVGDKILQLDDDRVVAVIEQIHGHAGDGDAEAKAAWGALMHPEAFVERLDAFRRSRIYHIAARLECEATLALFSAGEAARRSREEEHSFLVYGLADDAVGERMSKARRPDRDVRTQASYDTDPRVIVNLLENPRTTEMDVVRIAARRPADASVLTVIFRNKKWIARYIVKVALARNPYTPNNMSRNLLPQLLLKDLLEIRDDAALHASVRKAADRLIKIKRRRKLDEFEKLVN
ncbi:MAG: hypothetical protein M5R36_22525 [Deltaproteobacteria bacterium]|nr:hypothetical protein [Deltaproteobacteria bacterium]